jgi:hypothetical protein
MWSEAERREVFDALEPSLGGRIATLMTQGPPFDWSELARWPDVRAEFAAVRGEMAAGFSSLRGELAGEVGAVRGELGEVRGELGELRGELGELRGELGELRGELGGRIDGLTGRLLLMNIPVVFATAGLVLAAVKLG